MVLHQSLLYINGQSQPSSEGKTYEVLSPLDSKSIGLAAAASSKDCLDAVEAAAAAFPSWEATPTQQRRALLEKVADIMEQPEWKANARKVCAEELCTTELWDMFGIKAGVNYIREAAAVCDKLEGWTFPSSVPGGRAVVDRRAAGVVFGISPWNAAIPLTIRAIVIPLACGNTCVLKTSEYSPRSQNLVIEAFRQAGFPKGVLNCIHMDPKDSPELVANIIAHKAVKRVNFCGSDRVGRLIAIECAKHLKQGIFELGGQAPVVVMADANLDSAAKAIAFASMVHAGQVCMSTSRVIVVKDVAKPLTEKVIQFVAKLKADIPSSKPAINCLLNSSSAERIVAMVKQGVDKQGVKILHGTLETNGSILQPIVIGNVKQGTPLWENETFGPVVSITEAESIEEAITLANDSEYSLVASLWTNNLNSAVKYSAQIRAGSVAVNGATLHVEPSIGQMGLGGRSGYGRFSVENFTDPRCCVFLNPAPGYPLVG